MNQTHRETLEMPLALYFHLSRQEQKHHLSLCVLFVTTTLSLNGHSQGREATFRGLKGTVKGKINTVSAIMLEICVQIFKIGTLKW